MGETNAAPRCFKGSAAVLAPVDRVSGDGGGISFRRYMARRVTRAASAAGAFTRAYRSDLDVPDAQSVTELLGYLRQRGAADEVLRGARRCWDDYLQFRRRRVGTCP